MANLRRRTDGWFGWLTRLWDFIDAREIDKHVVSVSVMYGTLLVTQWAMGFAEAQSALGRSGVEIAATIAAVLGPYSLLQAAAIKFYFDNRNPNA
jgi:hypothetical protein